MKRKNILVCICLIVTVMIIRGVYSASEYERKEKYVHIGNDVKINKFIYRVSNPVVYSRANFNKYVASDEPIRFYDINDERAYVLCLDVYTSELSLEGRSINTTLGMLMNKKRKLLNGNIFPTKNPHVTKVYYFLTKDDYGRLDESRIYFSNAFFLEKYNRTDSMDSVMNLSDKKYQYIYELGYVDIEFKK